MSLANDFADSTESNTSSDDGYSSLEELSQTPNSPFDAEQASKSYWLGKMFMRFAQAHAVLRESAPEETVTDCDVQLEARLRQYPCIESLRYLQEAPEVSLPPELRKNTTDDWEAFYCALGHILLGDERLESKVYGMILRGLQYRGGDIASHWRVASDSIKEPPNLPESSKGPDSTKHSTKHERYYEVLCAHANRKQQRLKRKNHMTGKSAWTVTLTLDGHNFVGKGTNEDRALVNAAQKGCNHLGLEVI
nr:hypothetical protein CFP56_78519 [Quercus suber]